MQLRTFQAILEHIEKLHDRLEVGDSEREEIKFFPDKISDTVSVRFLSVDKEDVHLRYYATFSPTGDLINVQKQRWTHEGVETEWLPVRK